MIEWKPSIFHRKILQRLQVVFRFPERIVKEPEITEDEDFFTHDLEIQYLPDNRVPSFAEGRCQIIGEGDYKIVVADRDGSSDTVLKLYKCHEYRGENARIHAEAAARKIGIINQIANEVAPGFVLPFEMLIDEKDGICQVWERQQRAQVVSIHRFDPKTAKELDVQAFEVAVDGTDRVERELFKRGLARKTILSNLITDDFSITEIHWDMKTHHLVSLDIVDRVDIYPLLPPHLRNHLMPPSF